MAIKNIVNYSVLVVMFVYKKKSNHILVKFIYQVFDKNYSFHKSTIKILQRSGMMRCTAALWLILCEVNKISCGLYVVLE